MKQVYLFYQNTSALAFLLCLNLSNFTFDYVGDKIVGLVSNYLALALEAIMFHITK